MAWHPQQPGHDLYIRTELQEYERTVTNTHAFAVLRVSSFRATSTTCLLSIISAYIEQMLQGI